MDYPKCYDSKMRVAYYDTDKMGVVWHGNYLKYFENAREEMFRSLGLSYEDLEKSGIIMPVANASLRYVRPLRYGDEFVVRVSVEEAPLVRMVFKYRILSLDSELMAEGSTTLVFVDVLSGRPVKAPTALRG